MKPAAVVPRAQLPSCLVDAVLCLAVHAGWNRDRQIRAVQTCQTCLAEIEKSLWPAVAWTFSGLTGDGSPIEFGFSTHTDTLRYTVEVAGPECDEHERLAAACVLIARLGHRPPPSRLLRQWHRLQAQGRLNWGAWLGVRYREDGDETLKLYIEIPYASREACLSTFPGHLVGAQCLMLGYEPTSERIEAYFRKTPMDRNDLTQLADALSSTREIDKLIAALIALCYVPLEVALRWGSPAYSVDWTEGHATSGTAQLGLGFFIRAKTIASLGKVRQIFLAHTLRVRSGRSAYQELVQHLPDAHLPDHGAISIVLDRHGGIELRAGISGSALAAIRASSFLHQSEPLERREN